MMLFCVFFKAFAKLHGSYDAIRSGSSTEAMMDLTGCPAQTISFDDEDVQMKVWWKPLLKLYFLK